MSGLSSASNSTIPEIGNSIPPNPPPFQQRLPSTPVSPHEIGGTPDIETQTPPQRSRIYTWLQEHKSALVIGTAIATITITGVVGLLVALKFESSNN